MKRWTVRIRANAPCRGCVLDYQIEADTKGEAVEQVRRIARIELNGALYTVLGVAVAPPCAPLPPLGGAA